VLAASRIQRVFLKRDRFRQHLDVAVSPPACVTLKYRCYH